MLDGTAAQNGLENDTGNEEYTLMSIDTIINGKVIAALINGCKGAVSARRQKYTNMSSNLVMLWLFGFTVYL